MRVTFVLYACVFVTVAKMQSFHHWYGEGLVAWLRRCAAACVGIELRVNSVLWSSRSRTFSGSRSRTFSGYVPCYDSSRLKAVFLQRV